MGLQNSCVVAVYSLFILKCLASAEETFPWRWTCKAGKCLKTLNDPQSSDPALSLEVCKVLCDEYGMLWPKPTGTVQLGQQLANVDPEQISAQISSGRKCSNTMNEAVDRFKGLVLNAVPSGMPLDSTGKAVVINIVIAQPDVLKFSLTMDESYSLQVGPATADTLTATINATTYFGARHGLETLSQLFVYDDFKNSIMLRCDVNISDKPVYPYRGILLDTARSFVQVDLIKQNIDAMAANKLNVFHWHITDSHSFPFQSTRRPELTKYGAYSPSKVYTTDAIKEVVEYGLMRGVRVLPEFDAPAHVGEGWQNTNLTVCFKEEPWITYCAEPPCGQLDPTQDKLYEYLADIYQDIADTFMSTDMFHMGGDEVNEACWNTSEQIQSFMVQKQWPLNQEGFLQLWNYFQTKAKEKAYKAFGKIPIILWTSTLTDYNVIEKYLNKDDYIIQAWTTGTDPQIRGLLEEGYRLIISNYDALYLDCGFGAWVGPGNNWCFPYIGWQKVYENSPATLAGEYKNQILGGEAALWSEQADSSSVDGRLWPRAAALAERLWAEPNSTWEAAEQRILHTRERLVRMGRMAEVLEPEWCYQNAGHCYL